MGGVRFVVCERDSASSEVSGDRFVVCERSAASCVFSFCLSISPQLCRLKFSGGRLCRAEAAGTEVPRTSAMGAGASVVASHHGPLVPPAVGYRSTVRLESVQITGEGYVYFPFPMPSSTPVCFLVWKPVFAFLRARIAHT